MLVAMGLVGLSEELPSGCEVVLGFLGRPVQAQAVGPDRQAVLLILLVDSQGVDFEAALRFGHRVGRMVVALHFDRPVSWLNRYPDSVRVYAIVRVLGGCSVCLAVRSCSRFEY